MELSTQHKVLGVVLLLGGGAILLDRFILAGPAAGPAPAQAAQASQPPKSVRDQRPAGSDGASPIQAVRGGAPDAAAHESDALLGRLTQLETEAGATPDDRTLDLAFASHDRAWQNAGAGSVPAPGRPQGHAEGVLGNESQLSSWLRVTAILQGSRPSAIINGQALEVGKRAGIALSQGRWTIARDTRTTPAHWIEVVAVQDDGVDVRTDEGTLIRLTLRTDAQAQRP